MSKTKAELQDEINLHAVALSQAKNEIAVLTNRIEDQKKALGRYLHDLDNARKSHDTVRRENMHVKRTAEEAELRAMEMQMRMDAMAVRYRQKFLAYAIEVRRAFMRLNSPTEKVGGEYAKNFLQNLGDRLQRAYHALSDLDREYD